MFKVFTKNKPNILYICGNWITDFVLLNKIIFKISNKFIFINLTELLYAYAYFCVQNSIYSFANLFFIIFIRKSKLKIVNNKIFINNKKFQYVINDELIDGFCLKFLNNNLFFNEICNKLRNYINKNYKKEKIIIIYGPKINPILLSTPSKITFLLLKESQYQMKYYLYKKYFFVLKKQINLIKRKKKFQKIVALHNRINNKQQPNFAKISFSQNNFINIKSNNIKITKRKLFFQLKAFINQHYSELYSSKKNNFVRNTN